MAFWRTMPGGMKLRSNMSATNMIEPVGPLSLERYASVTQQIEPPVPLERFIAYGSWVMRTALPDVDRRQVTRLSRLDSRGFALSLDDGERVSARRVVVACGIAPFARVPHGFGHLGRENVSHTSEHGDFAGLRGLRVVIVGGGQSALESAALITEAGAASVEVLVRSERVVWLRGHSVKKAIGRLGPIVYAPTDVGPLWYSRLVAVPDLFRQLPRGAQDRIATRSIRPACAHFVRVRLAPVRISTGVSVAAASRCGDTIRVAVSDGSFRDADHLMFGTGYEVDFARYPFIDPGLLAGVRLAGGYPVLRRGLESSVPGLHVLGAPAAWSYGPIMRFVSGSWYAGRAVARALTK